MEKKNSIVKGLDFILYLYTNLIPDMGGFMKPMHLATLYLDMQLTIPLFLVEKIFPNAVINKNMPLIALFVLLIPTYLLIKWRNKKSKDLFKDYRIFKLPILIRALIFLLVLNGPIILIVLLLRTIS